MLLELGKAISFLLSILSLYPAMYSAFFVPGTRWEERLFLGFDRIALSACICFASGLLFSWPTEAEPQPEPSLLATAPVRMFFCALGVMAVLFVLSWYLAVYYVPLTYKYLPW
jgi:hypothetical protein